MSAADSDQGWAFWVDVGGTFTDCLARSPDGRITTHKLLGTGIYKGRVGPGSTAACVVDPNRCVDPPGFFRQWALAIGSSERDADGASGARRSSIRTVAEFDAGAGALHLETPFPQAPAPGSSYELRCTEEAPVVGIRYLLGRGLEQPLGAFRVHLGTTAGTNTLLERTGAATALCTTSGFADVLRIGYQSRPRLFDLRVRKPRALYRTVIEVPERIDAKGALLRSLNETTVRDELVRVRRGGVTSLAIVLLNSYRNPLHEQRVATIARQIGFEHVSLSSEIWPLQRIVPRGETTVVDAYLAPVMRLYIEQLRRSLPDATIKIMTSAGSLIDADAFVAKDGILSGPAGGVVGAVHVGRSAGFDRVIGFDMGGTSTDVSRYDGEYERRFEMQIEDRETGGATRIVAPMLAIETVAAGGGSICAFDGVKPIVGPRSAGADPGPTCYGGGGPLCVTDVNLYLGRLTDDRFAFPLDREAVTERLDALCARIESDTGRSYSPEELAAGFLRIANAHMTAAIRRISLERGVDPRTHALVAFGGAGGQHACAIADELDIENIVVHPHAGVLSAFGIGIADVTRFAARDVGRPLTDETVAALDPVFEQMERALRRQVRAERIDDDRIGPGRRLLELRYVGQDSTLTIEQPADRDWRSAFEQAHQERFGFRLRERDVEVRAARMEVTGRTEKPAPGAIATDTAELVPQKNARMYVDGAWITAPILRRESLGADAQVDGPAIIVEATGTTVVDRGWTCRVGRGGELLLSRAGAGEPAARAADAGSTADTPAASTANADPITLELFNNRFRAIAEQMGATLQRTALSTNVKERLDFSCAICDQRGRLVAHAPHIPVHLGAIGACVRALIEEIECDPDAAPLRPGEVLVSNDPYRGGSHLPDVTIITPVFDARGTTILFFTASRAHHAEIGGVAPGSMPPASRTLAEEGVVIRNLRLLSRTQDRGAGAAESDENLSLHEDRLRALLAAGPHPSRAIEQNVADIHAQVAANHVGVKLLQEAIAQTGVDTVRAYMQHIQDAAATKMRAALRRLPDGSRSFSDAMDDGTPLIVRITKRRERATVDFRGSGPVIDGNLNATPAIVASAVLYCFRCLIDEDIPLNEGVLEPIVIRLADCFLNPPREADPSRCAAVAGGNVETSQRIVDAVFGALGLVAASQGTMNNLTFGNERFGYYETIGGGSGAGPDWDGADAVHTHMTNTRLTDPEVLEERYPVRLRRFAIRRGSGGAGRQRGGDGIIREIEFLAPLELSLLTQRRTIGPYGVAAGRPGAPGRNHLRRADGEETVLGSLAQLHVGPGDVLTIDTPGGGGFGAPD